MKYRISFYFTTDKDIIAGNKPFDFISDSEDELVEAESESEAVLLYIQHLEETFSDVIKYGISDYECGSDWFNYINDDGEVCERIWCIQAQAKAEITVDFMGGESRYSDKACNYMLACTPDGDELYAEYVFDGGEEDEEGVDEDAGYDVLKAQIIEQAKILGYSAECLHFWYDD